MEINIKEIKPEELTCDGLISGVFSGLQLTPELEEVDKKIKGKIRLLLEEKEITGKGGEITLIHTFNEILPKRLLIVGLGKEEELTTNQLRDSFARAVKRLKSINCNNIGIIPPITENLLCKDIISSITEGLILGLYQFTKYITEKGGHKSEKKIENITFVLTEKHSREETEKGLNYGKTVSKNVNIVKDICNEPSNYMTPEIFASRAAELFKDTSIKCRVLDEKEIKEQNMNLLLAVGQGSANPPRLVVLEYIKDKNLPTVGIVGKGITFDTGGVTLKQSKSTLFEMKRDLTGGAVTMGIMKTLEELNFPVNCTGVIPLAENAIGNNAYKPGDIFYSMSGKTMEIFDTDCEGRLVLVDGFTYIQKYYSPKIIVDLATLMNTSSVIGQERVPFFTNNKKIVPYLEEASQISGEYVWQFPLEKKLKERILSRFADRKNRSYKEPQLLSIPVFLEDFINEGVDWIHIDLATVDTKYGETSYMSRGSTGFSARLVTRFLFNLLKDYLV